MASTKDLEGLLKTISPVQYVATSFEGRDVATIGAYVKNRPQDEITLEQGKSIALHSLANYGRYINRNNGEYKLGEDVIRQLF